MIQNGDKLLVCLSGGKDSMSLLHSIKQYQYIAKSKVKKTLFVIDFLII
jgi:tRNA(Ile)-lysidine synthase TilS/MesJ